MSVEALDLNQSLDSRARHRVRLPSQPRARRDQAASSRRAARVVRRAARRVRLRHRCTCSIGEELQAHVQQRALSRRPVGYAQRTSAPAEIHQGAGACRRGGRRGALRAHPALRYEEARGGGRAHARTARCAAGISCSAATPISARSRRRSSRRILGRGHLHHRHPPARGRARARAVAERCRRRRHQLDPRLLPPVGRSADSVRRAGELQRLPAAASGRIHAPAHGAHFPGARRGARSNMPGAGISTSP